MKELYDYRAKLIEKLSSAAKSFREACLAAKDAFAPLESSGWNTHQIAAHTRDVDQFAYGLRARRTASEENPEFENFDGEKYAVEHYDPNEPLGDILDGFVANTESLAELLRGLPMEAWARESRHATMGSGFTLQTWVEKSLAHIEEHTKAVNRGAG
ncbi:MAG: hypothetical protein DCC56_13755 [Anaerolineae bacterium]|nr:MAG: hypothetical protein DCC56_13755 [Anaerolineae bacterium]WKZ43254.1 MAG: hypothetical protein QY302_14225 [Anaerolineales bacterium]